MTPLRQLVILLGGQSVIITAKNEKEDREREFQDFIFNAIMKEPRPKLINLGSHWILTKDITGWYFRDYKPDSQEKVANAYLEFFDKFGKEDWQ